MFFYSAYFYFVTLNKTLKWVVSAHLYVFIHIEMQLFGL